MRNALAIARKELTIYFTTPWAYVASTAMAVITAFFFLIWLGEFQLAQEQARIAGWGRIPAEFKNLTDGVVTHLWQSVSVITLFIAPIFSMRLFSEERRQKTFELLMTVPVKPSEIVLGKFLGGLGALGSTLVLTLVFPLLLSLFGSSESGHALEWRTVLLGFGAVLLWGITCLAVGIFISALTESQALAAVLTFVVLLLWWLVEALVPRLEDPWRAVAQYVSFGAQLSNMYKGLLEVKTLVFFGSVILLSGLFTHRAIEAQRWT